MKDDGPTGFFRGLTGTWAREIPGYFILFASYEFTRKHLTPATVENNGECCRCVTRNARRRRVTRDDDASLGDLQCQRSKLIALTVGNECKDAPFKNRTKTIVQYRSTVYRNARANVVIIDAAICLPHLVWRFKVNDCEMRSQQKPTVI